MSYRLIDANALNGVISSNDYEKVLDAPCIFADLPNGLDGGHYDLQEPILDKIRAEIKGMIPTYHNPDWSITDLVPISEVLKLVDKYKAESEDKK